MLLSLAFMWCAAFSQDVTAEPVQNGPIACDYLGRPSIVAQVYHDLKRPESPLDVVRNIVISADDNMFFSASMLCDVKIKEKFGALKSESANTCQPPGCSQIISISLTDFGGVVNSDKLDNHFISDTARWLSIQRTVNSKYKISVGIHFYPAQVDNITMKDILDMVGARRSRILSPAPNLPTLEGPAEAIGSSLDFASDSSTRTELLRFEFDASGSLKHLLVLEGEK
jgi:hypothetical protein